MKELLPIGSIVELNNKYIVMIDGYYNQNYNLTYDLYENISIYHYTSWPFDLINIEYKNKELKKYNFYLESTNSYTEKNISKIIFKGYENEDFKKLKDSNSKE